MLESATLAVGKAVVTRAGRLWLGARTAKSERTKDLGDLIKVRFSDRVAARRVDRQLADIADSVVVTLCRWRDLRIYRTFGWTAARASRTCGLSLLCQTSAP